MTTIIKMHHGKRASLGLGLAMAGAFVLGLSPVKADEGYPKKPIEIIVPFAAGASTDLGMRVMATALENRWKVPVRVINKPGGNTVPAVNEVMNSAPEGYTILADGPPQSSMLETAVKTLPFKIYDRTFMAIAAYTPMKFIVHIDSPFKTLQDAADAAKKDPSSFTWTSLGGAGAQDMLNRQFFKALNIDITKTRALQLKGGSEAVTMTAGGHVNLGVGSYSAIAAPLQAKKLRVLAVASSERWPNLPDTPTAKEAGFPSIEVLYWIGFSGPKGLPADIVAKWDLAVKEITADPAIKDSLLKVGLLTSYSNAADMEARVRKEQAETNALWAQ
jgi:tripartite-type tricarboxylate transporter receptor subunit TctC